MAAPEYTPPDGVVSAVVHVASAGVHAVFVAIGPDSTPVKIGDAELDTGFSTNVTERLLYASWDITDHVAAAAAARLPITLSARVGAGKFGLGFTDGSTRSGLILELRVALKHTPHRSTAAVSTGGHWVTRASGVVYENLYVGEVFDARVAAAPGAWSPVSVIPSPVSGTLSPRLIPPVRVVETVAPIHVTAVGTAAVLDMGVNMAGLAELRLVPGTPAGHRVTMKFGEVVDVITNRVLDSDAITQTDTYIYSGHEKEGSWWRPSFVYHGFRFVEIFGYPGPAGCADLTSPCARGLNIHSDVATSGVLEFPEVNRQLSMAAAVLKDIHHAVRTGQLANLFSIPTDCPTREKRGWMGDAQWTAHEAALNFDMQAIYSNWLTTMQDMQRKSCIATSTQTALEPPFGTCCSPTLDPIHPTIFECSPYSNSTDNEGSLPDIVPLDWGQGGGRGWPGAPVWSVAYPVITAVLIKEYGDRAFCRGIYPGLKKFMAHIKRQAKFAPGKVLPQYGMLGDWLSLDPFCPGGSDSCLKTRTHHLFCPLVRDSCTPI